MASDPPLDCVLGRCDSLRAEVFFRAALPPGVDAADATLSGTLTGPDCRRAITLPVTARLAAVPGPPPASPPAPLVATVVARAILTEPSFWTPELPNRYRLDARLVAGNRELAAWQRPVGLRRLGVRGRSLWLDGRRYVPRGLFGRSADLDIAGYRDAELAAVVADPSDTFLERSDTEGVAVIGLLADGQDQPLEMVAAVERLAAWAWHPAAFVAVVVAAVPGAEAGRIAAATRGFRNTLLLAHEVDGTEPPPAVAAGIDLLIATLPAGGLPHEAWRTEPPGVPLMARRVADAACAPGPKPTSRSDCDALQAALAGWGTTGSGPTSDWAGYIAG